LNWRAFVKKMPRFDEWGLLLEGHEGPRENPILAAPVLAGPVARVPADATGEQASPSAPEVTAYSSAGGVGVPLMDASAAPTGRGSSPASGVPLPNLGVPRKRKGLESHRGDTSRALKKRKWIAVDE
jgi:hypothetical protein